MQHQINELICQCNDGKYRLKSNCTIFNDEWYETEYLNEQTILYSQERYWLDECIYSNYLDKYLPEDEFYDSHFYCEGCDRYFHNSESSEHVYGNTNFCESCYYDSHTYCYSCGEAISNDDSYYSEISHNDYCDNCYHDLHSYCENCGSDYWSSDGCDCGVKIHSYSYKPNPIYFHNKKEKNKYYLGIELETESKGNCKQTCAEQIYEISDLFYLKNDSSIEDGFEIVTHPFSELWFNDHKFIFVELLNTLRNNRFRSYNTTTCGIHIHISKNYLSGLDIAKLHLFFCQNENFIKTISQRSPNNLDQWGKIKKDKKEIYDNSKKKGSNERYTAINLQNKNTIEFRIFRGTTNNNSYFKNIEFVIAICKFVKETSLQQLNVTQFYNYINKEKEYKNLQKFMEAKKCA